ncbi:MAG: nucleotidyltransferase domain-containing protein [Betaproteobacteria bacterium]|nr:nucleotidyltransferase domain-containing protein [Betaproteobacteria bacterium]
MRLDRQEIDALAYALEGLTPLRVALFGSRVEPDRRGGDVDLLILADAPAYELSKRVATRFFSRCEEKIDVVVMPAHGATAEQQAFLDSITALDLV